MKNWIISVVAVVFVTSVLDLMLPRGRTRALIKSIFSVLAIFILIKPIFYIAENDNVNFTEYFESELNIQDDFLYYSNGKKIENYQNYCDEIIKNKGLESSGVKIIYVNEDDYTLRIEKVYLNIKKSVIFADDEHKNIIDETKKILSQFLSVDTEIMVAYEQC